MWIGRQLPEEKGIEDPIEYRPFNSVGPSQRSEVGKRDCDSEKGRGIRKNGGPGVLDRVKSDRRDRLTGSYRRTAPQGRPTFFSRRSTRDSFFFSLQGLVPYIAINYHYLDFEDSTHLKRTTCPYLRFRTRFSLFSNLPPLDTNQARMEPRARAGKNVGKMNFNYNECTHNFPLGL